MDIQQYQVTLKLERLAGGFPSNIDAYRTFLQNPMLARSVPQAARDEFQTQMENAGIAISEDGHISQDVVKTGFSIGEDGNPQIFNYQIKAMLQGAADSLYDRNSKPNTYQVKPAITHALEVRPERIPIIGGQIREQPWRVSQVISHPRNPNIKVPSNRERLIIDGGELTFALVILNMGGRGPVLIPILEDLLYAGGMFVGMGTDRGYGHGRFEVSAIEDLGVQRLGLSEREANPNRKGMGYVRKTKA